MSVSALVHAIGVLVLSASTATPMLESNTENPSLGAIQSALPPEELLAERLDHAASRPSASGSHKHRGIDEMVVDLYWQAGRLLASLFDDGCHVLLSLAPKPGGGSEGVESRWCDNDTGTPLVLGSQATLLHRYAQQGAHVAVWRLSTSPAVSDRWLRDDMRSRGWQYLSDDTALIWRRDGQRLDAYLTALPDGAGLVTVLRDNHE